MNKKALSPLVATMILVVFALIIGAITMNWGKSYVESLEETESKDLKSGTILIDIEDVDSDLKRLQIKHIRGMITEEEYLQQQEEYLK